MPLYCGPTRILQDPARSVDERRQRAIDRVIDAVKEQAKNPITSQGPMVQFQGSNADTLVVCQREVGVVSASSNGLAPSRICSLDATTCLIVVMRDPNTKRTACAHFDHGNKQSNDGVRQMLRLVLNTMEVPGDDDTKVKAHLSGASGVVELDDNGEEKPAATLQVYLLGSVKFDKFSRETCGDLLLELMRRVSIRFELVPDCTALWSLNTDPKTERCIIRGLEVTAETGAYRAVECTGVHRDYPAGRLRGLRCMMGPEDSLSSISLFVAESTKTSSDSAEASAAEENHAEETMLRECLQVIRPFKWDKIPAHVAQKPLEAFAKMSTTPDMEPEDFPSLLKASVVFGTIATPAEVFGNAVDGNTKIVPITFRATTVKVVVPKEKQTEEEREQAQESKIQPMREEKRWVQVSTGKP